MINNKNIKNRVLLITVIVNNDPEEMYNFTILDWPTSENYKKFYADGDDYHKHPTDAFAEYLKNLMPYVDIDMIKSSKVEITPVRSMPTIASSVVLG